MIKSYKVSKIKKLSCFFPIRKIEKKTKIVQVTQKYFDKLHHV